MSQGQSDEQPTAYKATPPMRTYLVSISGLLGVILIFSSFCVFFLSLMLGPIWFITIPHSLTIFSCGILLLSIAGLFAKDSLDI
jgi:hypothetical protein